MRALTGKRLAVAAVAAISLAGGAAVSANAAEPAESGNPAAAAPAASGEVTPAAEDLAVRAPANCALQRACTYDLPSFARRIQIYAGDNRDFANPTEDRATSVFNNSAQTVRLYQHPNFRGNRVCLRPYTGISNLDAYGMNNVASSIDFSTRNCGS
jgi:Peptidase inhibitor family I36